MKIYAPVKTTNGVYASVRFTNGVGETENPNLIRWFVEHGYTVDGEVDKILELPNEEVPRTNEPDFESMTPNELRDWMLKNGLGREIKNIRNKEKLIQIIESKKG